jgi:hypothetical protein
MVGERQLCAAFSLLESALESNYAFPFSRSKCRVCHNIRPIHRCPCQRFGWGGLAIRISYFGNPELPLWEIRNECLTPQDTSRGKLFIRHPNSLPTLILPQHSASKFKFLPLHSYTIYHGVLILAVSARSCERVRIYWFMGSRRISAARATR